MLAILGLDAAGGAWERSVDQQLTAVVDGLVTELLKHREASPGAQGLRRRGRHP
jgi:hypothetical protein